MQSDQAEGGDEPSDALIEPPFQKNKTHKGGLPRVRPVVAS